MTNSKKNLQSLLSLPIGFSLIEVMLAAFLGLLLLSGLTEVYLSIKTIYPLQEALGRIQENGRFIAYFLSREVREAGYTNCKNTKQENALQGYSGQNLPTKWKKQAVAGTDVITIKKCTSIKNKEQMSETTFFIGNTGRHNQHGEPIDALYEKIDDQPRVELVAGVENLHIQYGLSDVTNLDVARYVTATQLATNDWAKVRSVNISLLLNSIEEATQKPEAYIFDNEHFSAKNRLLHREWQVYIGLREVNS